MKYFTIKELCKSKTAETYIEVVEGMQFDKADRKSIRPYS